MTGLFTEDNTAAALRNRMIEAFESHCRGQVDKSLANVEVLLSNPTGIGEHGDILAEIEKHLGEAAKYTELGAMMEKHFR